MKRQWRRGWSDVASGRWPSRKVLVVDLAELVIDLGRKDALVAEALECEAKPPEASEEVENLIVGKTKRMS